MIPALKNIQDAVRIILRVPGGTWSLHVTDEDGSGEDPLFSSLYVVCPSGRLTEVLTAIGGDFEAVPLGGDGPDIVVYIRTEGNLEITVEEVVT